MDWIYIFLGALIAVACYLYLMTRINNTKNKFKNADIEVEDKERKKHSEVKLEHKEAGLKKRFCPLCNSLLKKDETLFAEMYEGDPRPRVIINGCRYCYVPRKEKKL